MYAFHYCVALGRPDLELDQRNLITLCETEQGKPGPNHHLMLGHLDDFKSNNLHVAADCVTYLDKDEAFIKNAHDWQLAHVARLKPLDEMTDGDKRDFIAKMNSTYPLLK